MNKSLKLIVSLILILIIIGIASWVWLGGRQEESGGNLTPTPTPLEQQSSPPASESATPSQAEDGIVKEIEVTNEGMSFIPNTITVNRGDVVRIIYTSVGDVHTFTLPEFDVDTGDVADGEQATVEFIASSPGSFEFYCTPHREAGMTGTLIVE